MKDLSLDFDTVRNRQRGNSFDEHHVFSLKELEMNSNSEEEKFNSTNRPTTTKNDDHRDENSRGMFGYSFQKLKKFTKRTGKKIGKMFRS
jgi:hypothetical protein